MDKNRSRLAKDFLSNPGSKRGGKMLKLERAVNGFGSLWRERWVEVKLGWLWCYATEKRPDKIEKPTISIPLANPTTRVDPCSEKFCNHFGQKHCLNVTLPTPPKPLSARPCSEISHPFPSGSRPSPCLVFRLSLLSAPNPLAGAVPGLEWQGAPGHLRLSARRLPPAVATHHQIRVPGPTQHGTQADVAQVCPAW